MNLDENGVWIDMPFTDCSRMGAEETVLPPPVPQVLNHLKSLLFELTTKRADGRMLKGVKANMPIFLAYI